MEFKFTASIELSDSDLNWLAKRVKEGESFCSAFNDLMAPFDDFEYYARGFIEDDVYDEVVRRINENII